MYESEFSREANPAVYIGFIIVCFGERFKELSHAIVGAGKSELRRAAGWKLRQGFCVAVLRRIPYSGQLNFLRPSIDWIRPTMLWKVIR